MCARNIDSTFTKVQFELGISQIKAGSMGYKFILYGTNLRLNNYQSSDFLLSIFRYIPSFFKDIDFKTTMNKDSIVKEYQKVEIIHESIHSF